MAVAKMLMMKDSKIDLFMVCSFSCQIMREIGFVGFVFFTGLKPWRFPKPPRLMGCAHGWLPSCAGIAGRREGLPVPDLIREGCVSGGA